MANLYEINEQILSCIDMETGEIVDINKLQELHLMFDEKIEGIACWIKNLLSEADAIKAEKDNLASREKACRNRAASLKNYLQYTLCGKKFKTSKVSISYRKSTSVEITDGAKVPEQYLKYAEPEVKKADIKKALEAGEIFEGVALIEKQNIQIK